MNILYFSFENTFYHLTNSASVECGLLQTITVFHVASGWKSLPIVE